jgi:hypothetical protein
LSPILITNTDLQILTFEVNNDNGERSMISESHAPLLCDKVALQEVQYISDDDQIGINPHEQGNSSPNQQLESLIQVQPAFDSHDETVAEVDLASTINLTDSAVSKVQESGIVQHNMETPMPSTSRLTSTSIDDNDSDRTSFLLKRRIIVTP